MGWTASTFKARWAEFAPCSDSLVDAALAEALEEVDERVYGAKADAAVGLLAAHKLSISPQGQQSRLDKLADRNGNLQHRIASIWARGCVVVSGARLVVQGAENLHRHPVAVSVRFV